ncbi:hypothetical protein M5689_001446 [Euphorbia peplus]|nr:hypothetical protein M5689_001446 [Euphorbia peplus]
MATAAFKSTSRRPTSSSSESRGRPSSPTKNTHSSNNPPPRRSRSVSAVSRSHHEKISPLSSSATDFLNKRDNPLYSTNSSPPDKESSQLYSKLDSSGANSTRGRSVSRNVEPKVDTGRRRSVSRGPVGRSVSRGPVGRTGALSSEVRSVSRGPVGRTRALSSESDDAEGVNLLTRYRNGSDSDGGSSVGGKSNSVRSYNSHATPGKVTNLKGSPVNLMPNASWENKVLGSLFSEGDRRCEQRKSFQEYGLEDDASSCIYETVRSEVRRAIADIQNDLESAIIKRNGNAVTSAGVVDLPPDLVNPGAVELVLDIRREYARKLEQSQEQARKLRAELEVEEHRGLELTRILKEVLPDPKTSNMRRSRPGRKSSIERRKMSRRLTEEAIAYFDECISLSTFDSSDFDSQDEPPIRIVGNSAHVGDDTSLSEASTSVAATQCPNSSPDYKQEWDRDSIGCNMSGMSATRSKQQTIDETGIDNLERRRDSMSRFSFGRNQSETLEFQHQIGEYVKNVERVPKISRSKECDMEEYNFEASSDSLLFDTLILKSKIESGSILVCGGGVTISLSPFAYVN